MQCTQCVIGAHVGYQVIQLHWFQTWSGFSNIWGTHSGVMDLQ